MKRFLTTLLAIALLVTTACGAAPPPQDTPATQLRASPGAGVNPEFSDVSDDAWYARAVAYCTERGIMGGTSATTFSPPPP